MKNILFLSSWYPSRVHTTLGNFVQYHAKAVAKNNNIHVLYITPDDNINGYEIVHNKLDELDTTIVYFKRGLLKYLNYWIAFKKGLRFVREAANGNVSEAILEMAKIYEQGRYVKKDLKVALDYYSKLQNNDLFDVKDDIDRIKAALNY